jgi:hypothetical protein
MTTNSKPLFSLGRTVATPGALESLAQSGQSHADFLNRHVVGDWGDVCEEDRKLNDEAVKIGERLLSSYSTKQGVKFWILTEADRSATTLLLPEEY